MVTQGNGAAGAHAMNAPGANGTVHVNPIECADQLLRFLQRVQFVAAERAAFDQCEMLCQALRAGQIVLASAPSAQAARAPEDAPPLLDG